MISPLQKQTNEAVAGLTQGQLIQLKAGLACIKEVQTWLHERMENRPEAIVKLLEKRDDEVTLEECEQMHQATAYEWITGAVMGMLREKVDTLGHDIGIAHWDTYTSKEKAMLLISAFDGDSGNHRVGS